MAGKRPHSTVMFAITHLSTIVSCIIVAIATTIISVNLAKVMSLVGWQKPVQFILSFNRPIVHLSFYLLLLQIGDSSAVRVCVQHAIDSGWLLSPAGKPNLVALVSSAWEASLGVAHLHREGVIHGGITPATCFLKAARNRRGFVVKVGLHPCTVSTHTHACLQLSSLAFTLAGNGFGTPCLCGWPSDVNACCSLLAHPML